MRSMRLLFCFTVVLLWSSSCLFAQSQSLQLTTVPPCRLIDTRQLGAGGPILGGQYRTFNLPQLAQTAGCQSLTPATAYSLNVSVVPYGYLGYLTICPTGESQPNIALLTSHDGRVKANAAIVTAGTNGSVNIFVTNTTDVILDINGYFQPATSAALAFFPMTPCRVADTRTGQPLQARVERDFDIQASGCPGLSSNALAYSFNFTAVPNPSGHPLHYLTVWPTGQPRPTVSTLNNYTATRVANAAIVSGTGTDGKVAVYPSDSTDLVIDMNGYFAPATQVQTGDAIYPVTPCRALDTRPNAFRGQQTENIGGSNCQPPSVATGYVLNATALPVGSLGYLTLWASGDPQPGTATLNAIDGAYTSNMALVGATSGEVNAYAAGTTNLVLDLTGYIAPLSTLAVSTSSLPNGTTGRQYQAQLMASGGERPYTWTLISGSLPAGLTMTADGLISGIPTAAGNDVFAVQVTDQFQNAATKTFTLNVVSGSLVITTVSLPGGTQNVPYAATLAASGGTPPYTWTVLSGTLPVGLTLNGASGLIAGTPTVPGPSIFTIKVQDSLANSATQNLGIGISPQNSTATINGRFAFSITAFNGNTPVYLAGSFDANGAGGITGELDLNTGQGSNIAGYPFTGTYTANANSLGTMQFVVPSLGTFNFLYDAFYNGNGQLLETDSNQRGSGLFYAQNTSFNVPRAGNYAIGSYGTDATLNRYAKGGVFTVGANGVVTAGSEDVNDNGTVSNRTFTGTFTAPDGSGRGVLALNFPNGILNNYVYYVVSAPQFVLMGID